DITAGPLVIVRAVVVRISGASVPAGSQQVGLDHRDRPVSVPGLPAEIHKAGSNLVFPGRRADPDRTAVGSPTVGGHRTGTQAGLRAVDRWAEPAGQFEHDALSALAPDARHGGQRR